MIDGSKYTTTEINEHVFIMKRHQQRRKPNIYFYKEEKHNN